MTDTQTMSPDPEARHIRIHGPDDFEGMRWAGKLAAETLDHITPLVVPGVTTEELDNACHAFILDHGAIPALWAIAGFRNPSALRSTMWSVTESPATSVCLMAIS